MILACIEFKKRKKIEGTIPNVDSVSPVLAPYSWIRIFIFIFFIISLLSNISITNAYILLHKV